MVVCQIIKVCWLYKVICSVVRGKGTVGGKRIVDRRGQTAGSAEIAELGKRRGYPSGPGAGADPETTAGIRGETPQSWTRKAFWTKCSGATGVISVLA